MNAPHTDTPRRLDLKDPSLFTDKAYVAGEWIAAPDGKTMAITRPLRWRASGQGAGSGGGDAAPRHRRRP